MDKQLVIDVLRQCKEDIENEIRTLKASQPVGVDAVGTAADLQTTVLRKKLKRIDLAIEEMEK